MAAKRSALLTHRRWWPLTATASFLITAVLASVLVPNALARWQLAGLASGDLVRQSRALAWAVSNESNFALARAHLGAALSKAESPESFQRLVTLMQRARHWQRNQVPASAWLTWLEQLAASDSPELRKLAVRLVFDAAEANLPDDPWHPLSANDRQRIDKLLDQLVADGQEQIAQATRIVRWAWSEDPLPLVFASVMGHGRPSPDFSASEHRQTLTDLWKSESGVVGGLGALNETGPASPPLVRLAALRNGPDDAPLERVADLLSHEDPWMQALAATIASRRLEPEQLRAAALEYATRADPLDRRAGYLFAAFEFHQPRIPGHMPVAIELPRRFAPHDPTERLLYEAVADAAFHTLEQSARFAAALHRDGVPYPTLLTSLLATRHPAAYDHLLGPFGLPDDQLLTLLDHYRFAWVLDALMPPEAPRFPLWVDRDTQLDAIAALRLWYARNRATWTHG